MKITRSPRRYGRTPTRRWASVWTVTIAALILLNASPAAASMLSVRVHDPETGSAIEGAKLIAYRIKQNGKFREVARSETDASGEAEFKLKKLGRNARYVIKARWQNRRLNSRVLNRVSQYVFDITGDGRLMKDRKRPRVRIKNIQESTTSAQFTVSGIATDDSAIASVDVKVKDKLYGVTTVSADIDPTSGKWIASFANDTVRAGKRVKIIATATDAHGKKRKHRLARKLLVGTTVLEPVVSSHSSGEQVPAEGFTLAGSIKNPEDLASLTVSVDDAMLGTTVDDATVEVDGQANWRFDVLPEHMSAGGTIEISLTATTDAGVIAMTQLALNVADLSNVDNAPPEITILSPTPDSNVSIQGFNVEGSALDNVEIDSLKLSVATPDSGVVIAPVDVTIDDNEMFSHPIAANTLAAQSTYIINLTAVDTAGNSATASATVTATDQNTTENSITIDSPADGGTSAATGFTLAGLIGATADIQSANVTVMRDTTLIVSTTPVELGADGSFNTQIETAGVNPGDILNITVEATTIDGAQFSQSSTTRVPNDQVLDTMHLLSRTTFGATPELVQQIDESGVESFLSSQLNPDSIDDSAFESFIAGFNPEDPDDLAYYALVHMVSSKRQLREVMTQFWENHFNTFVYASSGDFGNETRFEFAENNAFRANALGRFQDLLNVSAKSPSMLIYLNNVVNRREDANENYARELIELHTLGVDNGYEREDIEAAAEIFTGWHLDNDAFRFNADEHNFEAQTFLGETIDSGGVEQGERLLEILATHQGTASFICSKLAALFIADNASQGVVERCAQQFVSSTDNENQIAEVVRTLILSEEFAAARRSKVKTPIEFISSAVRAFAATGTGASLPWFSNRLGMRPFTMPVPTGYSELAEDWMNTNQLVERIKWAHQFSQLDERNENLALDPLEWVATNNIAGASEIVDHINAMLFGGDISTEGRQALLNTLNAEGEFDIDSSDAESRLRETIGIALSLPGFNYQ